MLMYGSILMAVTETPECCSSTPMELATTPFPMPEITPPVTSTYFILASATEASRGALLEAS
jgi:hypothetical protein